MSDDKPTNPNRRRFLEDLFTQIGREAGKAYGELRRASEELTSAVEDTAESVADTASATEDESNREGTNTPQRFDEIEAGMADLKEQMDALIQRSATPHELAQEDRDLLRQLLERLPEYKQALEKPVESDVNESTVEESYQAKEERRRTLLRRLNELIRLVAVWLAARSPDVLYETIFGDEIWPRIKDGVQWLFADAEASGVIEQSPLPTPSPEAPAPPRSEAPASTETPPPVETPSPRQRRPADSSAYPEFLTVPAGYFLMGSDKPQDKDAYEDRESPQHRLYLPVYRIARMPVTVAQFEFFVKSTGYEYEFRQDVRQKAEHPVTHVSWHDAAAYCNWLSGELGREIRLPTEAEWEKAARGADGRIYPWGNQLPDERRCNFAMKVGDTTPVGKYPQGESPYGCLDMAGNVWEWTNSWYKKYPYDAGDGREDPDGGESRVSRGGSFFDIRRFVRCASRSSGNPVNRLDSLGFRVLSPGL